MPTSLTHSSLEIIIRKGRVQGQSISNPQQSSTAMKMNWAKFIPVGKFRLHKDGSGPGYSASIRLSSLIVTNAIHVQASEDNKSSQ